MDNEKVKKMPAVDLAERLGTPTDAEVADTVKASSMAAERRQHALAEAAKPAKSKTVSERLAASRAVKQNVITEKQLLVSIISRMPGWHAYLCRPLVPQKEFPMMVVIETPLGDVMWRMHADEAPLFAHLKIQKNKGRSASGDDKFARLLTLATDGWTA